MPTFIGPNNLCKACMAEGRPDAACEKGQGKLLASGGYVHYKRGGCMTWAGLEPVKPKASGAKRRAGTAEPLDIDMPPWCTTIDEIKESRIISTARRGLQERVVEAEPAAGVELSSKELLRRSTHRLEYLVSGQFTTFGDDGDDETSTPDERWMRIAELARSAGSTETLRAITEYEEQHVLLYKKVKAMEVDAMKEDQRVLVDWWARP